MKDVCIYAQKTDDMMCHEFDKRCLDVPCTSLRIVYNWSCSQKIESVYSNMDDLTRGISPDRTGVDFLMFQYNVLVS